MAVERGVDDIDKEVLDIQDNTKELEVTVEGEEITSMFDGLEDENIETLEDGTMLIGAPPMEQMDPGEDFYSNLAETIDEFELGRIYSNAMADFQADKSSRKEWEQQYKEGLEYLGMKFEDRTEPFEGASGVIHPLLAESVTQFQAQAYKEMLPAGGPVRAQTVGFATPGLDLQAARVQEYMNYQLTQVMKEYDPETDQLLFYLPLSGSAFRKVHFDQTLNRAVSRFIPSEKMVVSYGATSLESANRITHVIDMSINDVKKMQQSGFYRKTSLSNITGNSNDQDGIQEELDELQGVKPSYANSDDCEIYEMHVELDIPGYEDVDQNGELTGIKLPYIVTLSPKDSSILSIRRNYEPNDPMRKRVDYFVHYKFLPGVGFYGFGLTHMIGGLSRGATSILRQLIDAGTLANLPGGFKARGIRIRDSDTPIQPGEFRDMDAPGGSLRDALMPLPFKEPSGTLLNLLGMLVESGQRFASIGDMQIGDGNQAAPVGTTVALLERGSRVMSAIHKRLHYSQRVEFGLLAQVFKTYMPPVYPYMTANGNQAVKETDFDDRIDIIPVSDPNIFSMSQRVMMAQEMLQMVQAAPEIHGPMGIYEAYKRMYEAMGIQQVEQLLPPPPPPPSPLGSAEENGMFVSGQPYQPFPEQNHDAHIASHLYLYETALVQMNPQIQSIIQGHIYAHIGLKAQQLAMQDPEVMQMQQQMQQVQQLPMGMPMQPGMAPPMNPQLEQMQMQMQNLIESKVSEITSNLMEQIAPSFGPQQPDDPLVELRRQELAIKAEDVERKAEDADQRIALDRERLREQSRLTEEKINSSEDIAGMKDERTKERLDQQKELKMADMANKSMKDMTDTFFGRNK